MLFLIFRIKTSLFCWSIITKKYSDVKIQLDLRFIKKFLCGKYSKLRWLGICDDIGEAEMEGHRHCCPNVALMCPCCPIVNFKHSAHCSANSVCRHDLSSQRKHNHHHDQIKNPHLSFLSANASSYSHYVFSTLDLDDTGVITFEVGQLI